VSNDWMIFLMSNLHTGLELWRGCIISVPVLLFAYCVLCEYCLAAQPPRSAQMRPFPTRVARSAVACDCVRVLG